MLIGTTNHESSQLIFIYKNKYPQSYQTLKYNHMWQWQSKKKSCPEQQAPEIMRNNFALRNRCDTFIYKLY